MYDSPTNSCLAGEVRETLGTPESTLNFNRYEASNYAYTSLSQSFESSLKYPIKDAFSVSGGTKLDFIGNIKSDEFTSNSSYSLKYKLNNRRFFPNSNRLNEFGQSVTNNLQNFLALCGDSFLSEVELGGELLVNVSIVFRSKELKYQYEASSNVSFSSEDSLLAIKESIKSLSEFKYRGTKIKVSAYQAGGNSAALGGILSSHDSEFSSSCTSDTTSQCTSVIDSIIAYGANQIPRQLEQGYSPTVIDKKYRTYSEIGVETLPELERL